MLLKCCTQYGSKYGNLNSGHGIRKYVFISIPKKGNAKQCSNCHILTHSFHMVTKLCSKFSNPGFKRTWIETFQMFKLVLEKSEEPKIKLQHPLDHRKSKRVQEKMHLLLFYWLLQSLWLCGSEQTGKVFKSWEYQTTLPAICETCMQVKKQHLDLDIVQTGSKSGKEWVKVVYCHSAYLTYIQSTSCEILGWMNHKLESSLPGEVSTTLAMPH